MEIKLKPKGSVPSEYTSKIAYRKYQITKLGKPAQVWIRYKLYFRNGILYAIENSYGFGVKPDSDCWNYLTKRCKDLSAYENYVQSCNNLRESEGAT